MGFGPRCGWLPGEGQDSVLRYSVFHFAGVAVGPTVPPLTLMQSRDAALYQASGLARRKRRRRRGRGIRERISRSKRSRAKHYGTDRSNGIGKKTAKNQRATPPGRNL